MPISLILTSFDYFQIRPSFAVTPNLILEPCLRITRPATITNLSITVIELPQQKESIQGSNLKQLLKRKKKILQSKETSFTG